MPQNGDFERDMSLLLDRLVQAHLVLHYEFPPDADPVIEWNEEYRAPLGGREAFLGIAILLRDLWFDRPMTETDQAMIEILRQTMLEE